jgi:hypothetical protein
MFVVVSIETRSLRTIRIYSALVSQSKVVQRINEERWPVWSDVDGVSGNAVLGEQLLGLETVRTVKAGKGHDFVDTDFVLA